MVKALLADFRDTPYWHRMTEEECKNYVYLISKYSQAQLDFELACETLTAGVTIMLSLFDIMMREGNALFEYERTLLAKYWRVNVPGNDTTH